MSYQFRGQTMVATPTKDRLTAAEELEAGVARMEAAYYENLAQVAA